VKKSEGLLGGPFVSPTGCVLLRLASAALQHNNLLCLQFTGGNIFLMKKNLVLYLKLN